jgi:CheY-like chemotaxis protein
MNVELKKILLVEDNPNDAELTLEVLGSHGLANQVDHVHDGEEALDYLRCGGQYTGRRGGAPCVVLLDLKLPKVSGLEVLREAKGDAQLRTIPVVVLTSSREERDLVESYRLGVNAYVVKPVDFPSFTNAVRALGMFWAVLNEVPTRSRGPADR